MEDSGKRKIARSLTGSRYGRLPEATASLEKLTERVESTASALKERYAGVRTALRDPMTEKDSNHAGIHHQRAGSYSCHAVTSRYPGCD